MNEIRIQNLYDVNFSSLWTLVWGGLKPIGSVRSLRFCAWRQLGPALRGAPPGVGSPAQEEEEEEGVTTYWEQEEGAAERQEQKEHQ